MDTARTEAQAKVFDYRMKMVGKTYRHFKGGYYVVMDIAVHSETAELTVIYKSLDNIEYTWARPLKMFLSPVDREKYPDVKQEQRFQPLKP